MEANVAQSLQFPTRIDSRKMAGRPADSVMISRGCNRQPHPYMLTMNQWLKKKTVIRHQPVHLEVSCSFQNAPASKEPRSVKLSFDNALVLKKKSQNVVPYLNERCIYLVGMMGSGKTTVGKTLAEVLNYSFVDCDVLVEQATGEKSVAEIFKRHGEQFFRGKESKALRELSLRHRLVVSTGGGAVIRPINWKYMQKGVIVWLDVPLKALAQRISAVGTNSRPLLQSDSGDLLEKTYQRLSTLWEERKEAYANANARISFESIASKLGQKDVLNLTPPVIAIEVLEQIEEILVEENNMDMYEL